MLKFKKLIKNNELKFFVLIVIIIFLLIACKNEILMPIGLQEVNPWEKLEFKAEVYPGYDNLIFNAKGDLEDFFDSNTATFTWIPGPNDNGTYELIISVTDGDLIEQEKVNIVVSSVESMKFDIKQTPTAEEYPEAKAIILRDLISSDYTHFIENDLFHAYLVSRMIKVFNRQGIEKYAELRINFNPRQERIFFGEIKTIKPDGTVTEVKTSGIHLITPPELSEANIYSDSRQFVINMPSLEAGSVIVYNYLKVQQVIDEKFYLAENFQTTDPIRYKRLELITPKHWEFEYKTRNTNFEPVIKDEKNIQDKYIWVKEDVEALIPEIAMPPLNNYYPSIAISSYKSWEEVSEVFQELIPQEYELTEEIKDRIKKLTLDISTTEEKIKELYNYVASNVRYVAISYGLGGLIPNDPVSVFENRYGDCKDKSMLLIAMLAEIGVEAEPVLINTSLNPDLDLVSFAHFNHMILYLSEKNLFLDASSEQYLYGNLPIQNQGKNVFLPLSNRKKVTPIANVTDNRSEISQIVSLNQNGEADIDILIKDKGVFDSSRKSNLGNLSNSKKEIYLQQLVDNNLSNAVIEEYSFTGIDGLEENCQIQLSLKVDNYSETIGDKVVIRPLNFNVDLRYLITGERKYPIFFGYKYNYARKVEIKYNDLIIDYLPDNIKLTNDIGSLEVYYKLVNKNKIIVSYDLKITETQIELEYYNDFQELLRASQQAFQNQILLDKKD